MSDDEKPAKKIKLAEPTVKDLYLDTVNRNVLDFDFEKICSVTMSTVNVYGCLVCGKFLQGRGKTTAAYQHSLDADHHVFINMETLKTFVLPDLYEVDDPSLEDIRYLLQPTYKSELLDTLSKGKHVARDLSRTEYLPGYIGLNNISATSFMNAILQALLHVTPLRDYFIIQSQQGNLKNKSELVQRFGMLCRKYWSPRLFKSQVSPHEFVQEVVTASARKFRITEPGDPLEFLSWLLNGLHRDLGGTKTPKSSIIYSLFQGIVKIQDQALLVKSSYDESGLTTGSSKPIFDLDQQINTTFSPFLFLSIDLPPPPVFQDAVEKNIIPQVPISAILAKYDGQTAQDIPAKGLRRYHIKHLPPILIMHFKRFTANNFVEERNPTIVNYPLKGVDMRSYVEDGADKVSILYDLVANITHEATAGTAKENTTWKVQVHTSSGSTGDGSEEDDEKWFQIQDLIVEQINKQVVFLGETYIQIWQRRLDVGEHYDTTIDPKAVVANPKTTKAISAKHVLTPEQLAQLKKASTPGVKMGKMRVEKGDSGGFEL